MHRNFPILFLGLSSLACGADASGSAATASTSDMTQGASATVPAASSSSTTTAAAAEAARSAMSTSTAGSSAVTRSPAPAAAGGGTAAAMPHAAAASGGSPAAVSSNTAAAGSSAAMGGENSAGKAAATVSAGAGGTAAAGSGGSNSEPTAAPKQQMTRCIDPSKAMPDSEVSFPCDGVNLWVYLPKQCQTQSCGLIFNIHGGGMTDHATMDQATNMIALGSQANYVVVHPHKGTWDVAGDRAAIFDFLQQSIQAFGVDPKRVHSTGYSQGGQLSWALACEHADVVASIAPAEEVNRVTDCFNPSKLPAREIPILFAYGHRDAIGGGYDGAQTLANNIAKAWQMQGPETLAGTESAKYFRQRWTSASGNVFEFISHDYTSTGVGGILDGHCLPMSNGTTFVSCATPVDYDWGKEVVTFFQAHPLP